MNTNKLLADIDAIHDRVRELVAADTADKDNDKLGEIEALIADLRDRVQDEGVE